MNTVSYTGFNENSKYYLEKLSTNNDEILILKNKNHYFELLLLSIRPLQTLLKTVLFLKVILLVQ